MPPATDRFVVTMSSNDTRLNHVRVVDGNPEQGYDEEGDFQSAGDDYFYNPFQVEIHSGHLVTVNGYSGVLREAYVYIYNSTLTGKLFFNDVGGNKTKDVYHPKFSLSNGFLKSDDDLPWAFCWSPGSNHSATPPSGSVYLGNPPGCTVLHGLKTAPYQ